MKFLQRYLRHAQETHRAHARIDFSVSAPSRVWPGSLPDVQLWRGLRLPGRVHSRFCPGNSLSCSKRNSRWISIGGRRASPIAKRPCHDYRRDRLPRPADCTPGLKFQSDKSSMSVINGLRKATWFFIIVADHSCLFLLINEMAHK